jgi:hypothetical protein
MREILSCCGVCQIIWFSDPFGEKKENRISLGTRKSGSDHNKFSSRVMQEPEVFSDAPCASPNRSENQEMRQSSTPSKGEGVWWSRFALPRMYAWQDPEHPIRLVEQFWKKEDPDPKALASSGVLWQEGTPDQPRRERMSLRFVDFPTGERDHHSVPGLVLRGSAQARQDQLALDLG